jgi:predicted acetyltransferase
MIKKVACQDNLPTPPQNVVGQYINLIFNKIESPGENPFGFVPLYHFIITTPDGIDVGHINFKIGTTPHIIFCAGHIGFEIKPQFRGYSYAYHACITLSPFIKSVYTEVILTADQDNLASIKTIEKLNTIYLGLNPIPKEDPNYAKGIRFKHRYSWKP